MKITYDESTDSLSIFFQAGGYHESDEIHPGFILDYDAEGRVIGVEILNATDYFPQKELSSVSFEFERKPDKLSDSIESADTAS